MEFSWLLPLTVFLLFFHYLFSKDIKNGLKQFFGPKPAFFRGRKKLNGTQDSPPLNGQSPETFPFPFPYSQKRKEKQIHHCLGFSLSQILLVSFAFIRCRMNDQFSKLRVNQVVGLGMATSEPFLSKYWLCQTALVTGMGPDTKANPSLVINQWRGRWIPN